MKKEIEVILPYLVRCTNGKSWYVEYKCFREKTEKLERFRIYKGFSELETVAEKESLANQLIKAYTSKLKSGWRPWAAERYIYHDQIEYWNVTEKFGSARNDNSHIRKYLSDYLVERKKELSPKSYESYLSKTRLFCQWLEKKGHSNIKIAEISNDILKAFFNYLVDERKLDKLTVVKYRQNIGGMFKYFKKRKLIDVIPMDDLPAARKIKDMAARPLMDSDIKLYFTHVAQHDPQLFLASIFQFYLCCRPGKELREMKIGDLDLSRKLVYIRLETGKTGKRMISMPDALIEICEDYKLNNYNRDFYVFSRGGIPGIDLLSKNHFSNRFRDVRTTLNLPKTYKFYSMKHTGAGKLLESGATFAELMSHCGHTSVESTIAYVRRHFGEKSQKVIDFRPDVLRGISQARG
jgi:integrase